MATEMPLRFSARCNSLRGVLAAFQNGSADRQGGHQKYQRESKPKAEIILGHASIQTATLS